ncbi:hypothetical protein CR513_19191, partial [Mucuna pruriens]
MDPDEENRESVFGLCPMSHKLLAQAGITEVGSTVVDALLHAYHMEVEQMHLCLLWPYLLYRRPGTSSLIVSDTQTIKLFSHQLPVSSKLYCMKKKVKKEEQSSLITSTKTFLYGRHLSKMVIEVNVASAWTNATSNPSSSISFPFIPNRHVCKPQFECKEIALGGCST